MEFFDVLKTRQSIRSYRNWPVEEEKLALILEAINSAPSAGNLQAYEIYLIRSEEKRQALARASLGQNFISSAPVVLVFGAHPARSAGEYGQRGRMLYATQDASIACTYGMLTASAIGLATVWVGAFADEKVRDVIGAPEGVIPVAILPIGYAAERPSRTSRRNLEDVLHQVDEPTFFHASRGRREDAQ
jgi:nitroreductase